jgi:eukaryotic-like serine/threonine-protein kinase
VIEHPGESGEQQLESIVDEFLQRLRGGEQPSIAEYMEKFPALAGELEELLASAAMIERLKRPDAAGSGSGSLAAQLPRIERLGDYRIIEEIGRGGMGHVMLGVHESLGRRVAIKILPPQFAGNEKHCERFRREAQAAATLHHPNIVSVFGAGRSEGYHYYVMEFIDGTGLNNVIRGLREDLSRGDTIDNAPTRAEVTRVSEQRDQQEPQGPTVGGDGQTRISMSEPGLEAPRERPALVSPGCVVAVPRGAARFRWAAEIMARIADALQYAHSEGKLHRDIKPSNLLLDREGRVWLTDFGLVKAFTDETMTGLGEIIGTPQYMAPESVTSGRYDERSEVYCLGLTLFELLTLKPAFADSNPATLLRKVASDPVPAPRRLETSIPRDLATIVEKATMSEPGRRYASAAALRDDLNAWLGGHPVSARRARMHQRLWLWSRRNPWAALSAGMTALVAIVATSGYFLVNSAYRKLAEQHGELQQQQQLTRSAQIEAEKNAERYRDQFMRAEANVALTLEMFDEMFRKIALRGGTREQSGFSFDGFEELAGVETAVTAQDAAFLEEMLEFLQRFADANRQNHELAGESARAYRRIANIYHLKGRWKEAEAAYLQAVDLYQSLAENDNDASQWRMLRAQTANELSLVLSRDGRHRDAVELLQKTREQLRSSPEADSEAVKFEIARTLNLAGSLLPMTDIDSTGSAILDTMPEELRRLRNRRRLIDRLQASGTMLDRNVAMIEEAIGILDQLAEKQPDNPQYLLESAKSRARLAELCQFREQPEERDRYRGQAIELLERMREFDPENTECLAASVQVRMLPVSSTGEARQIELEKACESAASLSEQRPGNLEFAQLEAESRFLLGQEYLSAGAIDKTIEAWQATLKTLERVFNSNRDSESLQLRYAATILELSELLLKEERYELLRETLVKSTGGLLRQGRLARSNPGARLLMARLLDMLAEAHGQLGDVRAAQNAARQAALLRQRPDPGSNGKAPRGK